MFSKSATNKDGLQYKCKACHSAYGKENAARIAARKVEYAVVNRDEVKASRAAQYAENKDAVLARNKAYQDSNPERIAARKAVYRAENIDTIKVKDNLRSAKWRKDNPHKVVAKAARYRAQQFKATPPWVNYAEIAAFYEDAKTLETIFGWPFHVDHIVPLNHPLVSGLHVPANLQILNASDNLSKSNTFEI